MINILPMDREGGRAAVHSVRLELYESFLNRGGLRNSDAVEAQANDLLLGFVEDQIQVAAL